MGVEGRFEKQKQFENDAAFLRNCCWFIRYSRADKDVRKWYRKAAKEKGRLAALGYDPELIRLYRLWMRRPDCERRQNRFYEHLERPEQLTLF